MTMHLLAPVDISVNDGITHEDFSLSYMYIALDGTVHMVAKHGRGALMTKVNLKSAFCLIPDCPKDHSLLAYSSSPSTMSTSTFHLVSTQHQPYSITLQMVYRTFSGSTAAF